MEKYRNFINDYRDTFNNAPLVGMNETSAKSVFERYSANGFIIVSPCESCEDNELNIERIRDMIFQIKSLKYAYMPVYALRDTVIHKNDRICQFRIMENQPKLVFDEVDKLEGNNRGGIGSTGTK